MKTFYTIKLSTFSKGYMFLKELFHVFFLKIEIFPSFVFMQNISRKSVEEVLVIKISPTIVFMQYAVEK